MANSNKNKAINRIEAAKPITSPLPNPKQERLCKEYLNPNSPGFANKSKAAELAGYTAQYGREALLQNPTLHNRLAGILHEMGLTQEVRGDALKRIITGHYRRHTKTTVSGIDQHGKAVEVVRETESAPSAAEIVKAIDVANKTDGTYDMQRASADAIGAELKSLFKAQRKALNK